MSKKKAWKKSPTVERQPCPSSSRLNVTYPSGWTLTLTLNLCPSRSSPTLMKITSQGPSHLQPAEQRYWVAPCHILCRSALSTWDCCHLGAVRHCRQGASQPTAAVSGDTCQRFTDKSRELTWGHRFLWLNFITPKVVRKKRPASGETLWEAWWFIGQMIRWRSEGTNQIKWPPNCARRRTTWKGTWEGRRSK